MLFHDHQGVLLENMRYEFQNALTQIQRINNHGLRHDTGRTAFLFSELMQMAMPGMEADPMKILDETVIKKNIEILPQNLRMFDSDGLNTISNRGKNTQYTSSILFQEDGSADFIISRTVYNKTTDDQLSWAESVGYTRKYNNKGNFLGAEFSAIAKTADNNMSVKIRIDKSGMLIPDQDQPQEVEEAKLRQPLDCNKLIGLLMNPKSIDKRLAVSEISFLDEIAPMGKPGK